MPIQGPQQPGFYLPGSEYFALSPNSTIALQGRRRYVVQPAQLTVPADGGLNFLNTFVLENTFTDTSGIYLHKFWLQLNPSGDGLSVNAVLAGLTRASAANAYADYPLGVPITPAPPVAIGFASGVNMLTEEQILIAAKDVTSVARGVGNTQTLSFWSNCNVQNSLATAVNVSTIAGLIYTRLDGLTE